MRCAIAFLALSTLAPLGTSGAGHAVRAGGADPCLPLHPARVRLTGAPQYQLFTRPGAPSDGRAAPADTVLMLALDVAADVCAELRVGLVHPATRVTTVELIGAPRAVHALIGYGVEADGRLAYAQPDAHHAEVVLYVDRMPIPGTDARSARRAAPRQAPLGR